MKNITDFQVDETKCIGCGLCKRACPSMLIDINVAGKAQIQEVERMDWQSVHRERSLCWDASRRTAFQWWVQRPLE